MLNPTHADVFKRCGHRTRQMGRSHSMVVILFGRVFGRCWSHHFLGIPHLNLRARLALSQRNVRLGSTSRIRKLLHQLRFYCHRPARRSLATRRPPTAGPRSSPLEGLGSSLRCSARCVPVLVGVGSDAGPGHIFFHLVKLVMAYWPTPLKLQLLSSIYIDGTP